MVWTIEGFDAPTFKQFAKRLKLQLAAGASPVDVPLHVLYEAMARTLKFDSYHRFEQAHSANLPTDPSGPGALTLVVHRNASPAMVARLSDLLRRYAASDARNDEANEVRLGRPVQDHERYGTAALMQSGLQALINGPDAAQVWLESQRNPHPLKSGTMRLFVSALELVMDEADTPSRSAWADMVLNGAVQQGWHLPGLDAEPGFWLKVSASSTDPKAWARYVGWLTEPTTFGQMLMHQVGAAQSRSVTPWQQFDLSGQGPAWGQPPSFPKPSLLDPLLFAWQISGPLLNQRLDALNPLGLHPRNCMHLFLQTNDPQILARVSPQAMPSAAAWAYVRLLGSSGAGQTPEITATRAAALKTLMHRGLSLTQGKPQDKTLASWLLTMGSSPEQTAVWDTWPQDPQAQSMIADSSLLELVYHEALPLREAAATQVGFFARPLSESVAVLQELLTRGARIARHHLDRNQVLFQSLQTLPDELLQPLLKHDPHLVFAALRYAQETNQSSLLQRLPQDLLSQPAFDQWSCALLCSAAGLRRIDWFDQLVAAGADPTAVNPGALVDAILDPLGRRPTTRHSALSDAAIVGMLEHVSAWVPLVSPHGMATFGSPLLSVTSPDVVTCLVRHGADTGHQQTESLPRYWDLGEKTVAEYWKSTFVASTYSRLMQAAKVGLAQRAQHADPTPSTPRRPKL